MFCTKKLTPKQIEKAEKRHQQLLEDEKLLLEVEKYDFLYDKSEKNYKNAAKKNRNMVQHRTKC